MGPTADLAETFGHSQSTLICTFRWVVLARLVLWW